MDEGKLERIGSFATTLEAEIAAAHLEAESVECSVVKDDGGGAFPSMTGLAGGASLVVAESDADRARQLLAEQSR